MLKGEKTQSAKYILPPIPKELKNILDGLFKMYGYIPNLERFLLFFPTYLQKVIEVEKNLFEEGPIGSDAAYFIAFCGAAELGCTYMMARYYILFQKAGGDLEWINNGEAPAKYKSIFSLNELMGRAVWQINESVVENLFANGEAGWTKS